MLMESIIFQDITHEIKTKEQLEELKSIESKVWTTIKQFCKGQELIKWIREKSKSRLCRCNSINMHAHCLLHALCVLHVHVDIDGYTGICINTLIQMYTAFYITLVFV